MGALCRSCAVEGWVYWLMPNHGHWIAVPDWEDGLRQAIGEAHRRYTRRVNFREGWRGHLWQGRFASCAMDEPYLLAAAPLLKRVGTWEDFLWMEPSAEEVKPLRRDERTGRPLESESFPVAIESNLRRTLRRGTPGPQGSRPS